MVEFEELLEDDIELLVKSGSWIGKAGSYDLAGKAGNFATLIEGDELAVLGFAPSALKLIASQ